MGVAGAGVAGAGVGVAGTGVAGTGVAGTGVAGTGVVGAGVAGAGVEGAGVEGEGEAASGALEVSGFLLIPAVFTPFLLKIVENSRRCEPLLSSQVTKSRARTWVADEKLAVELEAEALLLFRVTVKD